jgi:NarL family two-component system response regulator LiaR
VRTVAAGGAYFDPRIAHVVLRAFGDSRAPPPPSPLTGRETEIVRLIAEGRSNTEIAEHVHLALGTVKAHVADVLSKLSASDRAHAAVIAYRRGYIR